MNDLCADIGYKSVNHYGEELCGDHVDVVEENENSSITNIYYKNDYMKGVHHYGYWTHKKT